VEKVRPATVSRLTAHVEYFPLAVLQLGLRRVRVFVEFPFHFRLRILCNQSIICTSILYDLQNLGNSLLSVLSRRSQIEQAGDLALAAGTNELGKLKRLTHHLEPGSTISAQLSITRALPCQGGSSAAMLDHMSPREIDLMYCERSNHALYKARRQ